MNPGKLYAAALLASATLAAGCATPASNAPAIAAFSDCAVVEAELYRAEQSRRSGRDKENSAWKAVVPFAVAARYVSGKSTAEKADQRMEALRAELDRQGCDRHGG